MTQRSPERTARRIALYVYAPVAVAWIVVTDLVVGSVSVGLEEATLLNMVKGAAFVLVTSVLLYLLIRRELVSRQGEDLDLRTLAENVPDMIFRLRIRPDPRFEYVSPSSVDIGGYTPQEYYDDAAGVLGTVHPDDRERLQELLTDVDSETAEAELRWIHKEGHTFWGDIRVKKERDAAGHVVRISGVLRDVTRHRESERFRGLLSSALEVAGESVMITDRGGTIEYVNRAFTEITGYLPEDVIGRDPSILKSGEQDAAFYAQMWSTITSGRTFRGVMVNRRADGRLFEQATSITPVRGEDGAIEHFIAVARDITVQRALERRLRFTEKMDAVGQLAAGVAHDFRNLLNVVLVNGELLRDDDVVEGRGELDEILTAAKRGADLVGRLLRVARQPEVHLRRTDLGTLVSEMRGMLSAMLLDSIVLEIRPGDEGYAVDVDPDLMQDALLNLVANAGQAMPDGGRIVVDIRGDSDGPDVWVEVRDDGVGMDADTLSRVFDPFFTTKEHGTGLGLPMVKGIVERHGGVLDVTSVRGQGTTVAIRLPRSTGADDFGLDEPELGADPSGEAEGSRMEGRLLLVEDDERLRKAAERALTRLGYDVTTAEDGVAALEQIEADPSAWDLVISDLVMPRMGGDELYDTLQERGWNLPFLFMSGHPPEAVSEVEGRGSYAFLEKPWTLETLRRRVGDALDAERRSA